MKDTQLALRMPNPEDWTDATTAVKLTGLSRSTIYEMVNDGRLTAYRIGAHRLFWVDDVKKLADAVKVVRRTPDPAP
jgi:excisionase family DNA binding protein